MKTLLLLVPIALVSLSGCNIQRAMHCNQVAIQRSTCAIERNVEALNRVTANLENMQQSE